jgi:hypothetical protein
VGETFTVRKVSNGVGVERIFPVQSPAVARIEIKQRGHVRRSRLYYLRNLRGKKARLHSKVRDLSNLLSEEERDGPLEVPEPEAPEEEAAAEGSESGASEETAKVEPEPEDDSEAKN